LSRQQAGKGSGVFTDGRTTSRTQQFDKHSRPPSGTTRSTPRERTHAKSAADGARKRQGG
jgi:hypothetical protein